MNLNKYIEDNHGGSSEAFAKWYSEVTGEHWTRQQVDKWRKAKRAIASFIDERVHTMAVKHRKKRKRL